MRRFAGIDWESEPVLNETTILNLRHLLEHHELRGQFLQKVNEHLAVHRLKVSVGTIVDATIIHAPLLTNNNVNI